MNKFTSVAVFLYSAISLIVPSGFSVGSGLLVLGSIVLLRKRGVLSLDREDRHLMAVFFIYFLVSTGMNVLHGEIIREYDLPVRFLLAIPALLLLRAYPPSPAFFWAGLGIGGILAGLYTGWQNLFVLHTRAGGHTNPIQYGNISFIIGMLCLAGLGWAMLQQRARYWIWFLLCGFVMGMLGSLFTGSRGSWIGLPFCLYILYRCYGAEFGRRYVWGGIAGVVLAIVVVFAIPRTEVRMRAELAVSESIEYLKTRNANSSIGARMELWRVGVRAAAEHPLLGWGKAGFVAWENREMADGRVDPHISGFDHVHQEWLDALAKRGVLGLIVLLVLYALPLRLFSTFVRTAGKRARPYAIAGVLLFVNYICFGFSQVFLSHNSGVMTLAFTTVILWGLLRAEASKENAQLPLHVSAVKNHCVTRLRK
jgi:O-antigen ligase